MTTAAEATVTGTVLSIPLLSLPLRPSTLTALLRRGFATTGDIIVSVGSTMPSSDSSTAAQHDPTAGDENNSNPNTMVSGNDNGGLMTLAQEIGCSVSQSAEYVHEINDALNSIGLPQVVIPTTTTTEMDATSKISEDKNNDTNNSARSYASNIPATAASLLRTKINMQNNNASSSSSPTARQIVSFSQPLDMLLGGGFALSELTEIAGLPGSGKTQLAMQLCVDARLPGQYGGVEGCAVVIDAEGSWSSGAGGDRLWSTAGALVDHVKSSALRKMEANVENTNTTTAEELVPSWFTGESILDGIHIFRVHDEASQTCTLYNLPQFLQEQEEKGMPVKILVIDSLAFHYRVASSIGSSSNKGGNFLSTTTSLTRMAAFLQELASEFDLAVVALNHLTNKIDKDRTGTNGGMKLVPALGESWAHSVTSRLIIDFYNRHVPNNGGLNSHGDGVMDEVRTCSLIKSPHKPNGTALFTITDKGIRGLPSQFIEAEAAKRARLN
ncbi:hypothetical protein ACHAWC_006230 [Mediolabrus comicus]